MTVLKLDISFLPGFVALDLFGFVETPLFDFFSGFALFLFRFSQFDGGLFKLFISYYKRLNKLWLQISERGNFCDDNEMVCYCFFGLLEVDF